MPVNFTFLFLFSNSHAGIATHYMEKKDFHVLAFELESISGHQRTAEDFVNIMDCSGDVTEKGILSFPHALMNSRCPSSVQQSFHSNPCSFLKVSSSCWNLS